MSCTAKYNLCVNKGETFRKTFLSGGLPYIYKAITNIQNTSPVRITATGHSVPDLWPVAVVGVVGLEEIDNAAFPIVAQNNPPSGADWHPSTYIDANTIDLNDFPGGRYTAYESGGHLQYYTPVDLTGCDAEFIVYDEPDGTELFTLTSTPAAGVVVDNSTKTIQVTIADSYEWTVDTAYYKLNLLSSDGTTTLLISGNIEVNP